MTTRSEAEDHRLPRAVMIVLATALAAACLLPARPASALLLPTEEPGPRVRVYVQWNQDYLSLAAKIPDLMVTGSSVAPMSAAEQDDAIEFSFETPAQRAPLPAHRLIISAAGGMNLFTRDPGGRWRPDDSWTTGPRTIKYAVQVNGTLNDPMDQDTGFVVECAIPWDFLHGLPIEGPDIGFNVACWMRGDSEGVVSWAPTVREPKDVGDSLRWGRMRISTTAALAKAQGAWIPAPFVANTPFIDGTLAANEWLAASALEFDKPAPTAVAPPVPAEGPRAPATLLAVYRYDWQGNPGGVDGTPLWQQSGSAISDHPVPGAGPWYSYERVPWHLSQLADIRRAGIDIILPRYRGDAESRRTWARIGLIRLAQALKETRAQGREYPLVGMMLDTEALRGADLTSDGGKQTLYSMIRDFFLHVPREFWADLAARPQSGLQPGVPVLLGEPEPLSDWDGEFVDFCRQSFARDFDGARLVFLGAPGWRDRGVESFYAYVRLAEDASFASDPVGGAPAVALSPGCSPPPGATGPVRPRRDGADYRIAWQRALAARPELIVINSWNDFANGTEIAPSRQHGVSYVDATQYFKARLGSEQPHRLVLRQQKLPEVLAPGAEYHVELLVENAGTEEVSTGRRVTADYRIVRRADGSVVQQKTGAQGLRILPGETKRIPVIISARDTEGRPLPPGDYLFSISIVRSSVAYLRSQWFTRTLAELTVPITVGEPPARRATLISTSLPSFIEAGSTDDVVVRIRNDGAVAWRPADTRLSYHWIRSRDDSASSLSDTREIVVRGGAMAELPRDVAPGEIVSVMIPLRAADADGSPLPLPGPDDLWHYRVQWDLVEGEDGWFSSDGAPAGEEAVQVIARDWGVIVQSAETPAEMEAGATARVAVTLANAGHHTWPAGDRTYLTCQWYRWDGAMGLPDHFPYAEPTVLAAPVVPGDTVSLTAKVTAPRMAGMYWLTWDMVCGGDTLATTEGGRARDLLAAPVLVRGGNMRPLDISSFINVPAITTDGTRARGDFDGAGRSLPAEYLPPDLSGAPGDLYPSGYCAFPTEEPIPLAFPDTGSGLGGAVACAGQSVPLGTERVKRILLLAASTAGWRNTEFGLRGEAGSLERLPVGVPSWTERVDGSPVGASTPFLRSMSGDEATPAYLYLLTLTPTSPTAGALELPRAPEIKLLAITVEVE